VSDTVGTQRKSEGASRVSLHVEEDAWLYPPPQPSSNPPMPASSWEIEEALLAGLA
jgi:hypothetical protein